MTLPTYVQDLLAKTRWRQELNKRGYEGKLPVASERLAETLRAELRAILDNDGKPFDLQVARHMYDFAIAAKDLLTVSVKTVEDAMRVVADNQGAMESLTGSSDPPPPEVASETFGARIMRELLALVPTARKSEDPLTIVAAIADARERGMPDVAAKLEQKLLGTPLETPKVIHTEVVADSYEHGFIDGSMQDNFERGTINGHMGVDPRSWTPAYRAGFEAGRARRQASQVNEPVLTLPKGAEPRWATPGLSAAEVHDAIIAEVGMMAEARTPEMQAAYDVALAREGKVDSMFGPIAPVTVTGGNGVAS